MTTPHIKHILENLPTTPGVYQMKDDAGEILYIGKAKNLKNRVRSYFRNDKSHTPKTRKLVEHIRDIHYIETNSDLDAFLLETNLIKQYRPPYNILMRDDKFFVYLKITKEDFPRASIVRRIHKDDAWYYGPRTSAEQLKYIIKLIRKLFPIRDCTLDIDEEAPGTVRVRNNTRGKLPCMDYHIKMCTGPCTGEITKHNYQVLINEVKQFLKGSYQPIIEKLQEEMQNFAANHRFEQAAKRRDLIRRIEKLQQKQEINETTGLQSRDVIAAVQEGHRCFFNVFQVRNGRIINQSNVILEEQDIEGDMSSQTDMQESFLRQFYSISTEIPDEIYVEHEFSKEIHTLITTWLSRQKGTKVHLLHPKRGSNHNLLFLAKKNAISFAKQQQIKWINKGNSIQEQGPSELQKLLSLPNTPKRIECYDISHMGGTNTVGSMVVLAEGKPKPSLYRSFTLRTIEDQEIDDFKSIEEVLFRRLRHLTTYHSGITIRKLKKKEITDYTKFSVDPIIPIVYEVTNNEHPEGYIALYTFAKNKASLSLALSGDLQNNQNTLSQVFDQLWKHIGKYHLYVIPPQNLEVFFRMIGFASSTTIPKELPKQQWYHRRPGNSTQDVSLSKTPDLIVIDGGKGQLSHAVSAMKRLCLDIPIISLAKKHEEIFLPGESTSLQLPMDSPALLLLRQIRDEAHRFAVSLQTKKHRKRSTESLLDGIEGIGPSTRKKLLSAFGSVHKIKTLTVSELEQLIGTKTAEKVYKYFH